MIWLARILCVLFGIAFILIGLRAVFDPLAIMSNFHLIASDATGRSVVRADIGAFFIVGGGSAILGLFPRQQHWLGCALVMVGLAFTHRLIGVGMEGATPQIVEAMLIEAVAIAVLSFSLIVHWRKARTIAFPTQSDSDTHGAIG